MIIKSLKLKNYRNYDLLDLTFDPKTNILYGDNAQGKTNILEALYLSGTTKSHRGTKDRDMIQFGYDESHLETVVEKKGIIFQIDMHLKKNSPKGGYLWLEPAAFAGDTGYLGYAAGCLWNKGFGQKKRICTTGE